MNNKLNLFVPGKEEDWSSRRLTSPSPGPFSMPQSLQHTDACLRACACNTPKDGSGTLSLTDPASGRVLWNLFWSLGCIQEDSKPCENCPAFQRVECDPVTSEAQSFNNFFSNHPVYPQQRCQQVLGIKYISLQPRACPVFGNRVLMVSLIPFLYGASSPKSQSPFQ